MNPIWDKQFDMAPALFRMNIRRILLLLDQHKARPVWFKNTKRSRRRWRYKEGGWVYPPPILKTFDEAVARFEASQSEAEKLEPLKPFAGFPVTDRYVRKS